MKINNENIENITFPDFEVTEMEFLSSEKILSLKIEGAFYSSGENPKILNNGILKFSGWKSLTVRMYNPELEIWIPAEASSNSSFRELCILELENSKISLSGFGAKNGTWLEWVFENVTIEGEFEDEYAIVNKKRLSQELEAILNKQYDIVQISRWAERIDADHCRELEGDLDDVIMALSFMEHGPGFEYDENELRFLVKLLAREELEPIKKLNEWISHQKINEQ